MDAALLTAEDVAKALRIKKYTVYELIKRGELPSSKVGKQLRVSRADIERYLAEGKTGRPRGGPGADGGGPGADSAGPFAEAPPRQLIVSGQDKCLELLVDRIGSETGSPVLRSYTGCYTSLVSLYLGKLSMAASHLWDAETDSYNYPFIRRLLPGVGAGALRLAGRMQGLYVQKGNPLGISGWQDLGRPGITMINREKGCGTRILLDQKLAALGIEAQSVAGYTRESASHLACAGIVAKGGASLGCGCEGGAADIAGVEFIPLQLEWYDLVFRLADRRSPAVEALRAYVDSGAFSEDLEIMGGYDLSQTGRYEEF
jgi:putative molybdopterin biosynthesis protein